MPKVKKKGIGDEITSLRHQDAQDSMVELTDLDAVVEQNDSNTVKSVVKMKLTQFCSNPCVVKKMNKVVMDGNVLLGEGYLFANFHITRLLEQKLPLPLINRNLYYRAILAVSDFKCRQSTFSEEFIESKLQFDRLRANSCEKVNISGYNQLVADLSISMATMANNHLWLNIESRIDRYLQFKHPKFTKNDRLSVARAVLKTPTTPLRELFQAIQPSNGYLKASDVHKNHRIEEAKAVAETMRKLAPLPSSHQSSTRAHLLIPLCFHILKETIAEEEKSRNQTNPKKFKGRSFTILPHKSGFTISYVPLSSMFMCKLLKDMNIVSFKGDGRDENRRAILQSTFNFNAVETKSRRFANRIVTDGYCVGILLDKPSCLCCRVPCGKFEEAMREGMDEYTYIAGVDPGLTDVVTISRTSQATGVEEAMSYSSSQYYQKSHFYTSARRTSSWNKETEQITEKFPLKSTGNLATIEAYLKVYLANAKSLLQHRAKRGYRSMRFLRYIGKQQSIQEICNLVAPPKMKTVVGFGDWKGAGNSCISRKTCGPLQDIKFELSRRVGVYMEEIDEYNSSKTCCVCHQHSLVNMKTRSVVKKRDGRIIEVYGKVHKILHCKSSKDGNTHCGATWDRDVNASRNILLLTMCQLFKMERPQAFARSSLKKPQFSRRRMERTRERSRASSDDITVILEIPARGNARKS